MSAEQRLKNLGIVLPVASAPAGSYTKVVMLDGFAHLSGQGPRNPDGSPMTWTSTNRPFGGGGRRGGSQRRVSSFGGTSRVPRFVGPGGPGGADLWDGQRGAGLYPTPQGDRRVLQFDDRDLRRGGQGCPVSGGDGLVAVQHFRRGGDDGEGERRLARSRVPRGSRAPSKEQGRPLTNDHARQALNSDVWWSNSTGF